MDNFIIRKFSILDPPFLNPVDAAVSILCQDQTLGVPANKPIGVFQTPFATTFALKP
jgi:hypothetical protein